MKMVADLHTHTNVSHHAFSSLHEMILGAKTKGVYAIAITNHGPMMKDGAIDWHFYSLARQPEIIEGVRLYKGVEVNIINYDGSLDLPDTLLEKLDFVIASYHEEALPSTNYKDHTEGWLNVMKNPHIDCLGHSGNPQFACDINAIVEAAKKHNKIIEINSNSYAVRKGSESVCKEIAKLCMKHNVSIAVNSDSHSMYNVAEHDWAINMLESISFPEELIINSSVERLEKYFKNKIINL